VRIGELGERAGVSTKTIRFYESVGVLAPPRRTPSGYRDYTAEAVGRPAFVRAAQPASATSSPDSAKAAAAPGAMSSAPRVTRRRRVAIAA
jgi:DNA-binding transcriptional MerR regulator